jgi:membrane protein required for colicin V production
MAGGIAGIGIYLLALICFGLLNMFIIRSFQKGSESGMLDNMLGFIFGAARGALMVSLGFFLLSSILPEKEYPDWLSKAVTLPYVKKGAATLAKVAPDAMLEIMALERQAEGGVRSTMAPPPPVQPMPSQVSPLAPPAAGDNNVDGDTGYNRTTTQQLDRLIESTGSQ